MIRDIQEIQSLATKYSKQQLAHMAQIGMIDPTKAVMAGMMRDRISKEDAKPPTTTVAQDVMGMAPQQMGMQPEQSQPQQAPQPQEAPTGVASLPQEPQPNAGIEALPAGEVGSYAGGGIVAFDDGGSVPGYAGDTGSLVDVASITKTMQERQAEIADIDKKLAKNPPDSPDLQQRRGMLAELVQRAQTKLSANTAQPAEVVNKTNKPFSPFGASMVPPISQESANLANIIAEGEKNREAKKQALVESIRQKQAQGIPLTAAEEAMVGRSADVQARLAAPVTPVTPVPAVAPMPDESAAETARLARQNGTVPTFVSPVAPPAAAGAAKKVGAPDFVAPVGISGSTTKRPDINIPSTKIPYNEYTAPEARGLAAISKERRDQLAAMGVDEDMISKMVGETEAKKEKLSGRKGEAQGEALMQMGLGLMGARRGQEFQTLGDSGIKALQTYKSDMKDLRSAEEKLDDRRDTLRLAEQQAKRTGAESDIAKLDREKDRFEASKAAAAKERNDLEKSEAVLRMQGAQIKSYGDVSLYGTDVREETARQQLKVQSAQTANTANYQNRLLALNEARINSMDAASKAKMIKLKQESDKMFGTSPEYMALQKQLKGEFGDNFMTADKAKVAIELAKKLYFAQQIEGLGGLSSMGAGILDDSQLR
jgi:hypothetical protein